MIYSQKTLGDHALQRFCKLLTSLGSGDYDDISICYAPLGSQKVKDHRFSTDYLRSAASIAKQPRSFSSEMHSCMLLSNSEAREKQSRKIK